MEVSKGSSEQIAATYEIVVTYRDAVWDYAFSIVRRPELADDITQDVFLKAYQKIDTFRGDSSVKTWLLAITRNVISDYRRSSFFRKVILVDYVINLVSDQSTEKEVVENLVIEEVWRTVLELPPKLREVLVLQIRQELTIAEISEILHISEAAVKSRLHRAKKSMQGFLSKEDGIHAKARA